MSCRNFKTVDGSVAVETGIMDTSKGSLVPERLPVRVGKDMTTGKDMTAKVILFLI